MLAFEATDIRAWEADARCRDTAASLVPLFFSEEIQDINTAKRFCAACPVQADCLDAALERREPWGVWGGELFANGKILAQKRLRGRPPKVRAVEVEFDPILAARSA